MNPFLLHFLKRSVPLDSAWLTDVAVYAVFIWRFCFC